VNNLAVLRTRLAKSRAVRPLLSGPPAFRILMVGSSISMLGTRISTVAFPMLVLHLYNSPFFTGLVACAAIAPSMLAYIPAGVLVDRWNPRRVMIVSELLRGLAIASIVISLAAFGRRTSIWFLIFAIVAEEVLEIFSYLAERRYLSILVEREKLASSQVYVEVRAHAVVLAGRPVGPFLFAIQQFLPFLIDALSFVFSIGSLMVVKKSINPAEKSPPLTLRQLMKDVGRSFKWLLDDRRAWLTVLVMGISSMIAQALILMFLAEAHSKRFPTAAVGVVLAASGAGGAAGAIVSKFLPKFVPKWDDGRWLPIQMGVWSGTFFFLAITDGLSVSGSAIAMFSLGFTGAIGNIDFGTYIVKKVDNDRIAQVTSIGQMLAIGSSALGPIIGGAAIQYCGVHGAVMILLVIVLLLAFVSFFTPPAAQCAKEIFKSRVSAFPRPAPAVIALGKLANDSPPSERGKFDGSPDEIVNLSVCSDLVQANSRP
jgi:MFS family permease